MFFIGAFFTTTILLSSSSALACNSMANGMAKLSAVVAIGILLPMAILIPVELAILRDVGDLESRALRAYVYCLPAKIVPMLLAVRYGYEHVSGNPMRSFIAGELIYSAIHFVIAAGILSAAFKFDSSKRIVLTAMLISTVIPWAYTVGITVTVIAAAFVGGIIGA